MFHRGKDKLKSITIALAVKLGILCPEDAKKADAVLEANANIGTQTTLTLLQEHGFLDEQQAAKIRDTRQREAPLEELYENVKKARFAVRNAVPSRG